MAALARPVTTGAQFRHEALFYEGDEGFFRGTLPFIRDAVARDEPILIVVSAAKIRGLQAALGGDADRVCFADMAAVGTNPARIIPAWRDFVAEQAAGGRRFRGIGEPIWAERTPAALAECQRHERLLNTAFDGTPAWWLLCPYDTAALGPEVVEEALRSHPFLWDAETHVPSGTYRAADLAYVFGEALPPAPAEADELEVEDGGLGAVRAFVARRAASAGLTPMRTADLILAVNELATNSIRHGGGRGCVRMWQDGGDLVAEVLDRGVIDLPLIGRERPTADQDNGRGLWLVNQLCDLVQVRSSPAGTAVRLRMARDE